MSFRIIKEILINVNAKNGDIIFFSAGKKDLVNTILGSLRNKIAEDKKTGNRQDIM